MVELVETTVSRKGALRQAQHKHFDRLSTSISTGSMTPFTLSFRAQREISDSQYATTRGG
ncbi:MAG: hypothetical protein SFU91_04195 [Chloroherpetonaceae bacterium]|nr:hypothetical protein [Chloroherpetonaceae bacterium]